MASQKQVDANRKNAQRSTGPRSAAGKAKVALNALAHGLTAAEVVAGAEDRALFEALRAQLAREWRPGSVVEVMLVDRIGELIWQQRRVASLEVQVIERMPKWRPPGVPAALFPMAEAMAKDFARPNPTLMRVQLYQNRLERAMYRAIKELRDLQIERQMQDECVAFDEEEDAPPVPLPGERLGEGRPVSDAVERQKDDAEKSVSYSPRVDDAQSPIDSASPHLTSPRGRGTGNGPTVQLETDKTNPISPPTVGRPVVWAAGEATVAVQKGAMPCR